MEKDRDRQTDRRTDKQEQQGKDTQIERDSSVLGEVHRNKVWERYEKRQRQ